MNHRNLAFVIVAGCSSTQPAPNPPPSWGVPISGGTMLVTKAGDHAFIADPDRDRILDLDLGQGTTTELALQAGDEPGRLVEDGAGRIHVALRRGGALVTIAADQIVDRHAVCGEPRGLAWDAATDVIHVACDGGELVTLPAAGGDPVRALRLDRDLRDVLIVNGELYVSRFRAAELLALDASGAIVNRVVPPTVQRPNFGTENTGQIGNGSGSGTDLIDAIPAVAYRTIALGDGRVLMAHQRQLQAQLSVMQGGYGGMGCGHPVESSLSLVTPGTAPFAVEPIAMGALPVDLAVSPDGNRIALVLAGAQTVVVAQTVHLTIGDEHGCGDSDATALSWQDNLGAPTSVQFTPQNQVVVFYPELPGIVIHDLIGVDNARVIALPGDIGYDSGRNLFHTQTPVGLACASCHPEARDDGLVWDFANIGQRRTQNISGQILARAPYHWTGDEADIPTLMDDVFTTRMSGPTPTRSEHLSLGPFLQRVPAPTPVPAIDPAAAARGQTLFESPDVGCLGCHSGMLMTTKAVVDVGTGGAFKVPSLVGVGARAPFLHDGCAPTLTDRFGPCGGGDLHGKTSTLTPAQLADLVSYLETL